MKKGNSKFPIKFGKGNVKTFLRARKIMRENKRCEEFEKGVDFSICQLLVAEIIPIMLILSLKVLQTSSRPAPSGYTLKAC